MDLMGLMWTLRGPLDRVMGLPASHMVGAVDKPRPERRLGSTLGSGRTRDKAQRPDDTSEGCHQTTAGPSTWGSGIWARLPADFPSPTAQRPD